MIPSLVFAARVIRRLPFILAIPVVVVIRLIRPWFLVRWGYMVSSRIGHFAGNVEMYLCERDASINVPRQRYVDIFFMGQQPICNWQLAKMWRRILRVCPAWILLPIYHVNRLIPDGVVHEIGRNTQNDRDVHNLLDRFPPHLTFTAEEEAYGEARLRAMGIPAGVPFVCLNVRDSAYLDAHLPTGAWGYHNYRDCDIQKYVLAAEELAGRGYVVIRMGAKVREAIKSSHPKVVDYAVNGMRSDFMDIYLGAKCAFCITTATGFDAVPNIFRRPIVFLNVVPFGVIPTSSARLLVITRHHFSLAMDRELALREIFSCGVGYCSYGSDYESRGVQLIENTPEEVRDVVVEMDERLNSTWQPHEGDAALQKRFWDIFPSNMCDAYRRRPLHGEIRALFGAAFLRNNREWLR